MGKRIRRGLAALLLGCFLACGLSGCSFFENTEIVLTTGLSGNQLFKVGKAVCTLPEAMIYVMDYQRQYEGAYGVEMWEHDFGGMTLEDYVKETIISQLASMKATTLLAAEYEVTLDAAEEEKVQAAAAEYFDALSEEQRTYMDLEETDAEQLFEDMALSEKVYAEITKDVNTEVSDDEARIITVQQIRTDTLENAQAAKEQLDEGQDFGTVAASYSLDSTTTLTLGRGEKDSAYEEAAFALENDQVSDIVETDEGYYIICCVDNFDREATESNKAAMVEERRDEAFSQAYEALLSETPSEFSKRLWTKVHFSDWTGEFPPDFQAIYDAQFGE